MYSVADVLVHGLVERTSCLLWTMFPLSDLSTSGKYLFAWMCVRPGHDAYFPALMAANHVNLTGKLVAAWRYLMSAAMLRML